MATSNYSPEDGGPALFIGGGTGVVPFMSMLRKPDAMAKAAVQARDMLSFGPFTLVAGERLYIATFGTKRLRRLEWRARSGTGSARRWDDPGAKQVPRPMTSPSSPAMPTSAPRRASTTGTALKLRGVWQAPGLRNGPKQTLNWPTHTSRGI